MSKDVAPTTTEKANQPNTPTTPKVIKQPALSDLIPFDRSKSQSNSTMITRSAFPTPTHSFPDQVEGVGATARGRGSQVFFKLASGHTLWATSELLAQCRRTAEQMKFPLKSWNDFIGRDITVYLEGKHVMANFVEAPKKHSK